MRRLAGIAQPVERGFSLLALLVVAPAAWACVPGPGWDSSVAARYDAAAAVVLAKVLAIDVQGERWVYQFEIAETFKGSLPKPVWSPMNTCGIKLRPGTERVLFVQSDGQMQQNGQPDYPSTAEVAAAARSLKARPR